MSKNVELEACPFCGAHNAMMLPPTCKPETPYNPADRLFPIVRCGSCCAEVSGANEDYRGGSAIAAWNRRTPSPQTSPATEGVANRLHSLSLCLETYGLDYMQRRHVLDKVASMLAAPPPAKAGEGEYRPTLLRNETAGFTEFVTEDVPAITGHMFAANVEPIVRMSGPRGKVIGYRIYDPRTP